MSTQSHATADTTTKDAMEGASFLADMQGFLDDLRAFDLECKAEEYTDTGALWEIVEPRLERWLPLVHPETCSHPIDLYDGEIETCRLCGERIALEERMHELDE